MKRIILALGLLCASLFARSASAMICTADNGLQPPFNVCTNWAPSVPAGWTACANSNQPTAGRVKLWTGEGGGGYCIERTFTAGTNTVVTAGLGDYGGYNGSAFQIRSYWFNLSLSTSSTRYSQQSLACPTCETVPGNSLVSSGIGYVIKAFTFRN